MNGLTTFVRELFLLPKTIHSTKAKQAHTFVFCKAFLYLILAQKEDRNLKRATKFSTSIKILFIVGNPRASEPLQNFALDEHKQYEYELNHAPKLKNTVQNEQHIWMDSKK